MKKLCKTKIYFRDCIICLDKPRNILCRPCNDLLMCEECSKTLEKFSWYNTLKCPKCRRYVENFEKIFT